MSEYLDVDAIVHDIEQSIGRPMSEADRDEILLWRRGRDLAAIVRNPGWETVLEMIQSYAVKSLADAMKIKPGDNDRVLAAHAVAYALNDLNDKFIQDVEAAIQASRTIPEAMRTGGQAVTPGPIESYY